MNIHIYIYVCKISFIYIYIIYIYIYIYIYEYSLADQYRCVKTSSHIGIHMNLCGPGLGPQRGGESGPLVWAGLVCAWACWDQGLAVEPVNMTYVA